MASPAIHDQPHAVTYVAGEEQSRLQSAAKYFGIQNTRTPLNLSNHPVARSKGNDDEDSNVHSKSILKFGSTVWDNVGLIFSDSTLEAARMHSVGVMAREERIARDGTLHLMSISRRKRGVKPSYGDLVNLFERKPVESSNYEVIRESEDEEYEEVIIDSVEGGSITAAVFGIVKGTVGPAVLYLPRGFAMSGYAVAIPSMLIATSTYLYSATRLLQCWKVESDKIQLFNQKIEEIRNLLDLDSQVPLGSSNDYGSIPAIRGEKSSEHPKTLLTYPELSRRAFGKASVLISGGIAAMQFGVCLTYLIFVPQNLYESTKSLFGLELPKHVFLLGMLLLEIPLVWIRDIRKLTPINIMATMFIAFGLASVLVIALFTINDDPWNTNSNGAEVKDMSQLLVDISHLPPTSPTWFLFIGTSFFCFEGAITLLVPLQEAVYKKEDREKFPMVNRRVTASIVAFYIFFALICWVSFGDSVRTALTASLPESVLSTIVQFAYSIAVIFTFPLQAFPALEVVCHTTGTKVGLSERSGIFKRNAIASVIICLLGIIAVMAIDYLGNVVSLLGSLVGIPIALIYPPLMHNKLVKSSQTTRFLNYSLSLIGFVATGMASYTTIVSWNEGAEG